MLKTSQSLIATLVLSLTMAIGIAFLSACDKVGVKGMSDGQLHFDGLQKVDWTSDGNYVLVWQPTDVHQEIRYLVYMLDMGAIDIKPSAGLISLPIAGSPRSAYRSPAEQTVNPILEGTLLATVDSSKNNYQIEADFDPTHAYAFQAKIRNANGDVDPNSTVIFLSPSQVPVYKGCLKVVPQSASTMRIDVEFPQGASEVRVFRDDVLVKKMDAVTSTTLIDEGLKVGIPYKYRCEAQMGNDTLVGTESPQVETLNPFAGYEGCLEGKIEGNNVNIKFGFPDEADQVVIYRDGISVFTSRSPASTAYVDQELTPGIAYVYTCEAQKGSLAALGLKKLEITIPDSLADFDGCSNAIPLGASDIRVEFPYPKGADRIKIFRNGVQIYSTSSKGETSFVDSSLNEGQTYKYTCGAQAGQFERIGTKEFTVTTLSSNPPFFGGIKNVTIQSPSSVLIEWGVPDVTGVSAAYYQIFASVGTFVDWSAKPIRVIQAGSISNILTGLGDELPYAFGVRACSTQDVCDTNNVVLRATMPDGGAPKTYGALSAIVKNGEIIVSAPWEPKDGAIFKRKVFRKTGTTGGLDVTQYTLVKTATVDNIGVPPEELTIGNISENTQYHFIVIDEDPSGNGSAAINFASVMTGDLTPPSFTGIAGLAKGNVGYEATSLIAEFTATGIESPSNVAGASHYMFYIKENGGDSCSAGTLKEEVSSVSYPDGVVSHYEIKGLKEKTFYSVCMKTRDSSGNITAITNYLQKYTQDKTIPIFDGVQSMAYNLVTSKIDVVWNPSTSTDVTEYRVKIWKNLSNPTDSDITTFVKAHGTNANGFSFAASEFSFTGGDTIFAIVNACDNAQLIADGVQNCTSISMAYSYLVPDVTPPQGFLGVEGSLQLLTPMEGTVDVAWKAPTGGDWTDYRGFKIYSVDQTNPPIDDSHLVFLKDCPCSNVNCPNQITTCRISGLNPYRTYSFHVRAYDANGNLTTYLNPAIFTTAKRSTDTTPPQFASNLTAAYTSVGGARVNLTWNAGGDNQYAQEPGAVINYEIWRRQVTTFTNATTPETDADATRLAITGDLAYTDLQLTSNATYFYTICAVDASLNRNCDGVVRTLTTPDVEPPKIANLASTKDTNPDAKQWNLTWTMTDNSDVSTLRVIIRTVKTPDPLPPDDLSLFNITLIEADGIVTLTGQSGPPNEDTYIHYLVIVRDLAGNQAQSIYSVYSQNKVTVAEVRRATGTTAGGKMIVLIGSGFAQGATVKIGLQDCLNVQFYRKTAIGCWTPAQSAGDKTVSVTNPSNTGSSSLPNGYTYVDPTDPAAELCDKASSQGATFPAGSGISTDPYKICTAGQLDSVRNQPSTRYFKLMENIDLSSYTNNTFAPLVTSGLSYFNASEFDGSGLFVANWTYKNSAQSTIGFFKYINGNSYISNLNVVNVDIEGFSNVGIMSGYVDRGNCGAVIVDSSVQGKVRINQDMGGGFVGYAVNGSMQNITVNADVSGYAAASPSYYYLGTFAGRANNCNYVGVKAQGTVTGGHYYMGGITGYVSNATFSDCTFDGTVTRDTYRYYTGVGFGIVVGGTLPDKSLKSSILNCKVSGTVTAPMGAYATGGMVGAAVHVVAFEDSSFSGTVNGGYYAGGFVGSIQANIETAFRRNHAEVKMNSNYSVGGFIGGLDHYSTDGRNGIFIFDQNWASGTVAGTNYVGGFVGDLISCQSSSGGCNGAIMRKNYSIASVYGSAYGVGGFAGRVRALPGTAIFEQNYAKGDVISDNVCAGGFSGYWGAELNDAYAMGSVSATDYAGGFVGCVESHSSDFSPIIRRVYATGRVIKASGTKYGGLYGGQVNASTSPLPYVYSASVWDKTTTEMTDSAGDPAEVTAKTTAPMKQSTTFSTIGWDLTAFTGVWKVPLSPASYPIFMWQ